MKNFSALLMMQEMSILLGCRLFVSLLLRFGNLQLTDFNTLLSHSKLQGVLWKVFDAGVRLEYVFFCLVLSTCYSSQQFSLNTFAQLSLLAPTELQQAILLA